MAKVTVYQFEVYDIQSDQTIKSRRWVGTAEAVKEIACGRVIEDTAIEENAGRRRSARSR